MVDLEIAQNFTHVLMDNALNGLGALIEAGMGGMTKLLSSAHWKINHDTITFFDLCCQLFFWCEPDPI